MRTAALAVSVLFVAACAPKEAAEAPAPPPAPPAITVADFAGTWNASTNIAGATAPVETQLVIGTDGTGTMNAPGRDPVPLTLTVSGDSLIAVSAEYESLVQKGARVTIRTANALSGGSMSGTVAATYKRAAGDTTVHGTMTATKVP